MTHFASSSEKKWYCWQRRGEGLGERLKVGLGERLKVGRGAQSVELTGRMSSTSHRSMAHFCLMVGERAESQRILKQRCCAWDRIKPD